MTDKTLTTTEDFILDFVHNWAQWLQHTHIYAKKFAEQDARILLAEHKLTPADIDILKKAAAKQAGVEHWQAPEGVTL